MLWEYCKRGIGAGLVAGGLYGVYIATVGNPLIHHIEHMAGSGGEHVHAVSPATNALVSVGSGVLWGLLFGAVFGVAYYFLEPALPGPSAVKPYVLAAAGFVSISGVPWLVLPPTPPGVEQPVPTDVRVGIYGTMILIGVLLVAVSILAYTRGVQRGRWVGLVAGLVPGVLAVVLLPQLAPTFVSTGGLSPALVTAYQSLVAISQASLWGLIAGGYGWLAQHGMPRLSGQHPDEAIEPNA